VRPSASDGSTLRRMQRQRRHGTDPEQIVRGILHGLGARYRVDLKGFPGSPDIGNVRRRWVVFVHGCFWHHHRDCRYATIPRRNRSFWLQKFAANRARDVDVVARLEALGFHVAVVWECETRDPCSLRKRLRKEIPSSISCRMSKD
jgi:DNA mismatch endonuclease, patch repair protein